MNQSTTGRAMSPVYVLDRREAVPQIVGEHEGVLFVCGLAGTSKDIAALTSDGHHAFTMAGVMGAAVSTGLGLALARPQHRVMVVTGDGELLMNVGSLATAAVMNPPNLSILCVDNGHYGETGFQQSHTSLGVDLAQMAMGAGIVTTRTVQRADEIADGARALREANGTSFVLLRIAPTEPASCKRDMNADACRIRFRQHLGIA
jgi:thiamine pyrophosphate-dependent acetolactate synthase large subunit-like protein